MNNDYERYDFWHRETVQIKKTERSMKKLIESNRLFDEKNRKGFEYDPNDRSEDMAKVKNVKEILLEIHNKYILKKPLN